MKQNPRSVVEYLPPPHVVVVATLLESFHPRRSSRPVDQDKLTQREASHFIIAIPAEEMDLRGRREGAEGQELKMPQPLGIPFIAQTVCYELLWALRPPSTA